MFQVANDFGQFSQLSMEHVDLLAKLGDFSLSSFAALVLIFVFVIIAVVVAIIIAVHGAMAFRLAVPPWMTSGAAEVLHRTRTERVARDDQVDDLRGAMRGGMSGMLRARMSEGERVMAGAAWLPEVSGTARGMAGMGAAMGTGVLGMMARQTVMRPLMVTAMVFAAGFAGLIGRGVMLAVSSGMGFAVSSGMGFAMGASLMLGAIRVRAVRPAFVLAFMFVFAMGRVRFPASTLAGFAASMAAPMRFASLAMFVIVVAILVVIAILAQREHEPRTAVAFVVVGFQVVLRSPFVFADSPIKRGLQGVQSVSRVGGFARSRPTSVDYSPRKAS
ncbi:MAG TPA: hypothetical protein VGN42_23680 [Pirellulales bacterium]|nr:hypothetical protein [Pirellulales bacterium]